MDELTGYVSPIEMLYTAVRMQTEEHQGKILMKTVQEAGFDVDKDELMKALRYDRHQYEKGYADAMKNAVPLDKLCEWLAGNNSNIPCEYCQYFSNDYCTAIGDTSRPCPRSAEDWREAIAKWMEETKE